MRTLQEEEFKAWLLHPVTKDLMKILAQRREELRRSWEAGSFTDYETSTTALINVGNLGTCKGYAFVMELTYEQYLSEIDDAEYERFEPPGLSSTD